jgi:hypothetical protein
MKMHGDGEKCNCWLKIYCLSSKSKNFLTTEALKWLNNKICLYWCCRKWKRDCTCIRLLSTSIFSRFSEQIKKLRWLVGLKVYCYTWKLNSNMRFIPNYVLWLIKLTLGPVVEWWQLYWGLYGFLQLSSDKQMLSGSCKVVTHKLHAISTAQLWIPLNWFIRKCSYSQILVKISCLNKEKSWYS